MGSIVTPVQTETASQGTRLPLAARAVLDWRHPLWLLAMVLFLAAVFQSAWLCDDAFISYRTADNFIHGHGLTWNTHERVQSYTHPLWLFLFTAVYSVTREPFYTGIFLSMAVSAAAVALYAWKVARSGAAAAMGVLILASSVAFVDYSTSGLENPLTHLLLAIFLWIYLRDTSDLPAGEGTTFLLSLVAALAAVNRMDSVLLFVPALCCVLYERRSWRCLFAMAMGWLPLVLWMGFSTFYYGFPFPNTAYAKLNNGIPAGELAVQGLYYLWHSLRHDPITLVTITVGIVFAIRQRKARPICVAVGIVLYLLYVVRIGGDFMSGRFLTAPLFAAVCLLGTYRWASAGAWALAACGVAFVAMFTVRPFGYSEAEIDPTSDAPWLQAVDDRGVCDEHSYYYSATGLLAARRQPKVQFPCYQWAADGKNLRVIAASFGQPLVVSHNYLGFCGYYAGPNVRIVDNFGLADPLLARLPPVSDPFWRIGHFWRPVPLGLLGSLRTGKNMLSEPGLAEYYDRLAEITQGRLWSWDRLAAIWNMNLGRYEHLLKAERERIRGMLPPDFQLAPDPPTTVRELSQRISTHPKDPFLYACRAAAYAKLDEPAKAIQDITRAISLDSRNALALNFRGMLYARQGQSAEALDDYSRALDSDPRLSRAYVDRGQLHLRQGDTAKAIADFSHAIEVDADAIGAYIARGGVYQQSGDWRQAAHDFQQVIHLLPIHAIGYHLKAGALASVGKLDGVYGWGPTPPSLLSTAFGNLAWILATHPDAACRDGQEAVRYAQLAMTVGDDKKPAAPPERTARLLDVLAAAYAEAGRFSEAAAAAREAVELAVQSESRSTTNAMRARLALYEAHKPYRVSPTAP